MIILTEDVKAHLLAVLIKCGVDESLYDENLEDENNLIQALSLCSMAAEKKSITNLDDDDIPTKKTQTKKKRVQVSFYE